MINTTVDYISSTAQAAPLVVATTTIEVKPPSDTIFNNCWLYLKSLIPSLPSTKALQASARASTGVSHNGDVIVFDYPHYGLQINSTDEAILIRHSNWQGDGIKETWFKVNDPRIVGHWSP